MSCPISMVVARASYLSQTSNLSDVTLYTPSEAGVYRVNVYAVASDNSSAANVFLGWTDEFRGETIEVCGAGGNSFGQASIVLYSAADEPITFSTEGLVGNCDLFFSVVQE